MPLGPQGVKAELLDLNIRLTPDGTTKFSLDQPSTSSLALRQIFAEISSKIHGSTHGTVIHA